MSDVYKIGVQLALTGNMAEALAGIGRQLFDLDKQTEGLMKKWGSLGDNAKLAVKGAGLVAVGGGVLDFFGKALTAGEELVHVQQQMVAAGTSQVDIAEATAEAYKDAATYGMKVADVLSDIKESTLIFGSTGDAIKHLGDLEKLRTISEAVQAGTGKSNVEAVFAASKSGELKGLTGDNLANLFDGMTKAIEASGGKVTANDFMQATKYGKLSSVGWDEHFYTHILPAIIQETGASTAGTSLMSLYGALVQGKVTQRALGSITDLGLIGDPSKITYDRQGNPKGFNPGAVKDSELMTKDPYAWIQQDLLPAIEKKDGHKFGMNNADDLAIIGSIFGNRNAAAVAALLSNSVRIDKDVGLIDKAPGLAGAQGLMDNDPGRVMQRVTDAWSNLMTAFGAPAVAPFLSGLNLLAAGIQKITSMFASFSATNPELAKILSGGVGVAGVGLVAGGAGMIGLAAYRSVFGLPAAAAALNSSAALLSEAAIGLGAKGSSVSGGTGGSGRMGLLGGLGWAGALLGAGGAVEAFGRSIEKDHPWLAAILGTGGSTGDNALNKYVNDKIPALKKLDQMLGLAPKDLVNFSGQPRHPASGAGGFGNPMAGFANIGAPPPINVAPPQVNTQVSVKIGDTEFKAYITKVVNEVFSGLASSLGGFSKGAPTPNSGTMMPAVDAGSPAFGGT